MHGLTFWACTNRFKLPEHLRLENLTGLAEAARMERKVRRYHATLALYRWACKLFLFSPVSCLEFFLHSRTFAYAA